MLTSSQKPRMNPFSVIWLMHNPQFFTVCMLKQGNTLSNDNFSLSPVFFVDPPLNIVSMQILNLISFILHYKLESQVDSPFSLFVFEENFFHYNLELGENPVENENHSTVDFSDLFLYFFRDNKKVFLTIKFVTLWS